MIVPMMKVWEMRVRVFDGLVRVFMCVPKTRRCPRMRMGVVHVIVAMRVDMRHRFMEMAVCVAHT